MTPTARAAMTYTAAVDLIERALASSKRDEILAAVTEGGDFARALSCLRTAMRSNTFPTGGPPLALERLVRTFDQATRAEGFHVLESWDYRTHRFSELTVPVLMLDRCTPNAVPSESRHQALAVLLDQYFLSILGLLATRAWDSGDPNANLTRVRTLLDALSAGGSRQHFIDDTETLLLVAISHYHPHEPAYDGLLARVRTLGDDAALRLAVACASTLGSHLRWGHRFMYQRDVGRMRDDNVVDYPWLLFSLVTLMREFTRANDDAKRATLAESLLNGLSADPWAFTGPLPRCLAVYAREHEELRSALHEQRAELRGRLAEYQPSRDAFTPLGFLCNFRCNGIVAMAATALAGDPRHPSLNGLFTAHRDDPDRAAAAGRYARSLMSYAVANGGRSDGAALIVYDPFEAQTALNTTARVLAG
jgi:hypothetical protein